MQERSTIEEAEAILGLDRRHIRKAWRNWCHLPGVAKIGRRWTFSLSALREHVRAKRGKAATGELAKAFQCGAICARAIPRSHSHLGVEIRRGF